MTYACAPKLVNQHIDFVSGLDVIFGSNPKMLNIMDMLQKVKDLDTTVLITGETGTGKSLLAKYLHRIGLNGDQPFVHINCAGIPASLLESELFGFEKGAFTGAQIAKPGRFEIAQKGTVFLDEIGSLPLELQAKLLTMLEERKVERLGSTKSYEIESKIIAASNTDLETMVQQKKFRDDLYYRLNVIQISVPPLRYHKEDIEVLTNLFVKRFEHKFSKFHHNLSPEVRIALKAYDWPGNIRELENTIERAVALAAGSTITLDDIPEKIRKTSLIDPCIQDIPQEKLQERTIILEALKEHLGSRVKTADYLGISRRTLQNKLKQLRIT